MPTFSPTIDCCAMAAVPLPLSKPIAHREVSLGSPRKCSAVLLIDDEPNQDVRSTSSNCRRTVPDPTMRAAFTDIGCKMFWRSECLPNTTMQCYGRHRIL